ncbi:MAG: M48 family metallopeptidase [Gammaproteobacteria bacterium]|nr:M48 family metallopeptidase [Gammaproteobacteria bacterium]MDH3433254.1 M48 family metallopeptidase [Gammaproteobacteria bacterium]
MNLQRFRQFAPVFIIASGALSWSLSAHAISDAELAAEAAKQFAEMKASMPLTTDRDTIEYIACVANAVVSQLDPPHSDLAWEMAIFDNDAVNAFAMPGGKIGVMVGILKAAQNQDQLAAVIGHEIAHVTADHSKERASRGRLSNVGIQVAAVLLGGGNQGATYTAYEALNQAERFGIMLPFNRKQESEADVIGLKYMARAGFDPRAAVPLWQNMTGLSGREEPAEFTSTHPSSEKRIDSLVSQWIDALPYYNAATQEGRVPNCIPPQPLPTSKKE